MQQLLKKETLTPLATCPHCGKENDRSSCVSEDARPSKGDLSICIGCGAVSSFNEDLSLRKLTTEETRELMASENWPTIERVQRAARDAMKAFRKMN